MAEYSIQPLPPHEDFNDDVEDLPESLAQEDDAMLFPLDEDLPDIEPSDIERFETVDETPALITTASITWIVGSLILAVLLLAQWGWWERHTFIKDAVGRQILESLCAGLGCEVPLVRAPEQIDLGEKPILEHDSAKAALIVQATLVNKAKFPQALPQIELGLYNANDALVAQRRFAPAEYLPTTNTTPDRMEVDIPLAITLELVDPGNKVTGLRFDFF